MDSQDRGVVLKVGRSYAIVLTPSGEFKKAYISGQRPRIGEEIPLGRGGRLPFLSWRTSVAACIAVLALLAASLGVIERRSPETVKTVEAPSAVGESRVAKALPAGGEGVVPAGVQSPVPQGGALTRPSEPLPLGETPLKEVPSSPAPVPAKPEAPMSISSDPLGGQKGKGFSLSLKEDLTRPSGGSYLSGPRVASDYIPQLSAGVDLSQGRPRESMDGGDGKRDESPGPVSDGRKEGDSMTLAMGAPEETKVELALAPQGSGLPQVRSLPTSKAAGIVREKTPEESNEEGKDKNKEQKEKDDKTGEVGRGGAGKGQE